MAGVEDCLVLGGWKVLGCVKGLERVAAAGEMDSRRRD